MSRKVYAAIFAVVVTATVIAASLNYAGRALAAPVSPSPANELLGMLPASDAVAFLDTQRSLNEVLPRMFVNDSTTLARVNQEIDKFRDQSGTDMHSIDAIAIGVRFRQGKGVATDFVMGFVRGRFAAGEAITSGLAKAKAKRATFKWTEEQYEGVTIYSPERSGGFSMAAVDSNTIAFGDTAGIKAALDTRAGRGSRVDSSLVELATLEANAVAGFAANVPPSLAQEMAGTEEFGKSFATVRQIYGSVDSTTQSTGTLNVTLRSETNDQAQALAEKLGTLRQIANIYISQNAKQIASQAGTSDNTQAQTRAVVVQKNMPFAKWIKDVTITAEGNDVKLKLEEPLADFGGFFFGR
jgi:hypothetical protein